MFQKALLIILATGFIGLLSSCGRETELPAEPANIEVIVISAMDLRVNFMLRNESDMVLHYSDGYRLYHQQGDNWMLHTLPEGSFGNETSITRYISPNVTRQYSIQFCPAFTPEGTLEPGHYRFVRNFFVDPNNTATMQYVSFEFEVQDWRAMSASADPMAEQRIRRNRLRQDTISFILAGGTSEILQLASGVMVNRSGLQFEMRNYSNAHDMYGMLHSDLAVYENGTWRPVASLYIDDFPVELVVGEPIEAGTTLLTNVDFGDVFGALPHGRYMLIHNYAFGRPQAAHIGRDHEFLLIEFIVDGDTPDWF